MFVLNFIKYFHFYLIKRCVSVFKDISRTVYLDMQTNYRAFFSKKVHVQVTLKIKSKTSKKTVNNHRTMQIAKAINLINIRRAL